MDVFVNFNDLRHEDDLLNNLFEQVRNFNDLLLSCEDWDDFLLDGWDGLNSGFDNVSNILFSDESINLNNFVLVDNNFFQFSISSFN